MKRAIIYTLFTVLLAASCNGPAGNTGQQRTSKQTKSIVVPAFNADSAYFYVEKQVLFGPRVPGTEAHTAAASWFAQKLGGLADTLIVQHFRTRVYNRKSFDGQNIIASFNPGAQKRILLAAHWDSRPYADFDPVEANRRSPIDGANDGASGVGVLIELARMFKANPLNTSLGVDIILFDLEDYGPHNDERTFGDEDYWALGSQHWARNMHQAAYSASFGILLDMVGAKNAVFPREYYSQQYASWVLDKVWRRASQLGYGHIFSNKPGPPINDDHIPLNRIAGIPTINIIHLDTGSSNGSFFEYWHTLQDNMDQIGIETLNMVGTLVATVVYEAQ
jgi:glutaminyl-peptide cyclotransferase